MDGDDVGANDGDDVVLLDLEALGLLGVLAWPVPAK
eukprot:CAMPEP_0198140222 /NCGR_PEP_ID=MMETSP1443-20131203/3429_1 /TAXON_ID=186043 /ORGANISM="Entomoneis sp., Strain CCMP2396" /LENGTH=35 /DNA_ID= /DNA_START= /DNA_END= /DNA_ORIENTATION=